MRPTKVQPSRTTRILGFAILGAAALLSLSLASGAWGPRSVIAAQEKPGTTTVTIDNFRFAPMQLEIKAGTEVTWINKDDVPHTVVSDDRKLFKSRALDTDENFSFTFKDPGTYEYFCSVHPSMTGKIIVK
jgi:plastocyanin